VRFRPHGEIVLLSFVMRFIGKMVGFFTLDLVGWRSLTMAPGSGIVVREILLQLCLDKGLDLDYLKIDWPSNGPEILGRCRFHFIGQSLHYFGSEKV